MTIVLLVMLAVAGLPARILVILLIGAVLVVVVAIEGGFLHQYQIARLTSFLHQNSKSPSQQSLIYNLQQAKNAIVPAGCGARACCTAQPPTSAYVPEQQTDFIFTAVGEQLGFVGATGCSVSSAWSPGGSCAARSWRETPSAASFVRVLHLLRLQRLPERRDDDGIMPITGIPLPFMSYGGSSALCFFMGVGLALSVYARRSG